MAIQNAIGVGIEKSGSATITFPDSSQTLIGGLGWVASGETWTYSSVDDPTGVITVPSDATTKYSEGMRIKFTNGGNTIYGIITAVTSTTITFLHEIDSSDSQALNLMEDSTITNPYFSPVKAPFGFPLERDKWTVYVVDTSNRTEAAPSQDTWYNTGSITLDVPIGSWDLGFSGLFYVSDATTTASVSIKATLSTANNSESDSKRSAYSSILTSTSNDKYVNDHLLQFRPLDVSSKTTYYLNISTLNTGISQMIINGTALPTVVEARCAYL